MRTGRRSWATRSEIVDAGPVLIGLMLVMLLIVSMLVMPLIVSMLVMLLVYMLRKAVT